ncbi:MAG: tetratricopeptide repeat protein [Candidatus Methylomirabilales bacterium]
MLPRALTVACLAVCLPLVGLPPSAGAQLPGAPPHIERILKKLQSGQSIGTQEEAALERWGASMEQAAGRDGVFGTTDGAAGRGEPGDGELAWPTRVAVKDLPAHPPSREAYVALVKEVARAYGQKLGKARAQTDSLLRVARRDSDGANLGAALLSIGAGSAGVYAMTWSALRKPDDVLTASNLGVALSGMGDHRRALLVLRYAETAKPNAPLILLNLGWTHFNMGDPTGAKRHFERAVSVAPHYASAHLGLGLVAAWQGDVATARAHLRRGLAGGYSRAAAAAYRTVQGSGRRAGQGGGAPSPIATERDRGAMPSLPDPPIYPSMARMARAGEPLQRAGAALDRRIAELQQQLESLQAALGRQMTAAAGTRGAGVWLPRRFEKELFLLEDITVLVLGEPGELGVASRAVAKEFEGLEQRTARALPGMEDEARRMERTMEQRERLLQQYQAEMDRLGREQASFEKWDAGISEQIERCYSQTGGHLGGNEAEKACARALQRQRNERWHALQRQEQQLQRKYDKLLGEQQFQADQGVHRSCVQEKRMLDDAYTTQYKAWKAQWDAYKRAIPDYYAFTNPVLQKIYDPTLNELLNVDRELKVLLDYRTILQMGGDLPRLLERYNALQCVEPQPPQPPEEVKEPKLEKKRPQPCPFKKPLALDIGVAEVELDCQHFKLEAGQGIIGSVERDFVKHETTLGLGVGLDADAAVVGAGGKAMVKMTVGPGDEVRDVTLVGSLEGKVGAGPGVGGEVEASMSLLEGGPPMDIRGGVKGAAMSLDSLAE